MTRLISDIAQNGYGSASAFSVFNNYFCFLYFSFISIKILAVVLANIFTFGGLAGFPLCQINHSKQGIALETAVFVLLRFLYF